MKPPFLGGRLLQMTNMGKMKNCLNQGGPFLRGVGAVTVQLYGTFKKLTQIIFPHSIIQLY